MGVIKLMKPHRTSTSKEGNLRLDAFKSARLYVKTMLPCPTDPVRTRIEGMLRNRDLPSLTQLGQFRDQEYQDHDLPSLLVARQVAALFKKNEHFSDDETCKSAAKESFLASEIRNRITNKRLDHFYLHEDRRDPVIWKWIGHMQRDIMSLVGEVDDFVGKLPSLIRLTNGATEDRSRRRSHPFLKVTGRLRGPRSIIPFLGNLLQSHGVDLASLKFDDVSWNLIHFVPKNWATHRTIAKEPTHLMPFQLAIDAFYKERLRRWGVDLRSQSRNQELARIGSIDGSFATIDLKEASNSLCYNAVALCWPSDWFRTLCSFRSASYSLDGEVRPYSMFSSMGNGYTFTIETIIFTAACRAVGSRQYAVYGDDIVIESEYAPSVVKLLAFLGFKTNVAKTFMSTSCGFRESCGCDYWRGHLITPFYLRECPKYSDRAGLSHVLNGLVGCASVPGPLWSWLHALVLQHGIRLVPWNEDSRSGVWITPNRAWRTRRLKVDHRRTIRGEDNPDFGFPIFEGYGVVQERRKTLGWRSLYLWFLNRGSTDQGSVPELSNRTAVRLLQLNRYDSQDEGAANTATSFIIERSRYVHSTCRYRPTPTRADRKSVV